MKRLTFASARILLAGAGIFVLDLAAGQNPGQDPLAPGGIDDKVLFYPVKGVLDRKLSETLVDDITRWRAEHPTIRSIILQLDSAGTQNGELEPAVRAAHFLADLKNVRVIAHIPRDKVAGNASALLALAARDLVMSTGARLGFLPAEEAGEAVEVSDRDPKDAKEARDSFVEFAEKRRGLLGRSHLASAMVSRHHPPIFKVRFEKLAATQKQQEIRFLTQEETANLPQVEKQLIVKPDVLVVGSGLRLTLDQEKAREYGFAIPVAGDDRHELLLALNLKVGEENIIDHQRGGVLKPISHPAQTVVDFLNHPVVRFLLILGGTLGFLLEAKMPGTLIPSLGGLACFAAFLISGLYPARGAAVATTSSFEVLLFVLGLGLLGVELLLLPGVILFGLSGAAACLISLVLAMVPPPSASVAGSMNLKQALTLLVTSAGTGAVIFLILLRFLPRSRFLGRSGLVIHSSIQGTPTADSAIEAQTRAAALLGRVGAAITSLRPAGAVEVDGERIDVVTEGEFVEKGEKVEIIETDGTRIVVRKRDR